MFDYEDDVTTQLGSLFNIDFSQKYRTLSDIKNIVATVKNNLIAQ